ncbi:MAG: head-tail connector protein [Thermovenabulum sp.]|uniref:head-tail connector protein n=1 Tax=Thermovenabulum sp. TaxID=3100335 RepID=UPI003C7D1516
MILTLEEAKKFLRVDDDAEDVLIQGLITSAEEYIKNATGKTFDSANELAKLACKLLVAHWYENRGIDLAGINTKKISFSLDVILTQLKYCYEGVTTV